MSFATLKKRGNSLATLQKKLEETSTFSTSDDRIWKPTTDTAGNGAAVIRFLPAPDGEDLPFVKLYTHGFKGPTGSWYIENSLTTLGQTDPIGELNKELWNSGDESLKAQVRNQKRKLNYYSNIYVIKDSACPENEGKVFLFRYGKKIFDKIMDAVNGDELEDRAPLNPFDLWEGADFRLRVKKVEGYPNYDSSSFATASVLENLSDAQLEAIWKLEHPLLPIIAPDKFKSYDELQAQLNRVLELSATKRTQSAAPKPSFANKPEFKTPDPEPEVEDDSEIVIEDDVIDYFKQLSEN